MKFIVFDTETTNSIDDPIVYDLGFAVVDEDGKVYESYSFVVADIFLDKELMSVAYFADKREQYWKEIRQGKRQLRRFKTIKNIFYDVCKQYDISILVAHNARFDYNSLTLTQRWLTSSKYRYFFPYGVEFWDTLKMAREVLRKNKQYSEFCHENGYLTKNGQKQFTVEVLYRFLTNDVEFVENHTGLEDVLIEKEILKFCLSEKPEIDGALWKRD